MAAERADGELLAGRGPEEFGVFYRRHVGAVTSFVAPRARRADLTFDVVAETFARALEHRDQYEEQRGPAVAWLLGIARNLLVDAARRGRVDAAARQRLGMARIELDDRQLAMVEECGRTDLADALAGLSVEEREVVLRRVLADEPYPLIAEHVGCSEQVARKRASRGLAKLRQRLEDSDERSV